MTGAYGHQWTSRDLYGQIENQNPTISPIKPMFPGLREIAENSITFLHGID